MTTGRNCWRMATGTALAMFIAAGGFFSGVEARVRTVAAPEDIESIRFLSPNNMPVKVLVVYSPNQQNENFVLSLINIVAGMHEKGLVKPEDAFKVHVIPGWEMTEKDYAHINSKVGAERVKKYVEFNKGYTTRDMWMQDWGEVGVVKVKGESKPQTAVFDSNRGRDNAELPQILANFWNSYLVKNPSDKNSGGDYGGNIEVTPDNILLIGNTSTPELRNYLEKHGYKDRMAVLETDWLHVGHVDEYISVCPNPKALRGYTLIKANPRMALRMIMHTTDAELKLVPHKDYRDALLMVKKYLVKAEADRAAALKLGSTRGHGAKKVFSEAVLEYLEKSEEQLANSNSGVELSSDHFMASSDIEKFIQLNLTLGNLIDSNVKKACNKISEVRNDKDKPHSVISFPALYRAMYSGKHIAYLPGSINQLILNNQLIVPDPKVKAMRLYISKTAEKIGLHANFIDSMPYHNLQGQIHCGTNVFRHPNKYFVVPK
ncbi:MAG TPA: protein-arginine deiminase family protein [Candidatus Rifleibacterium sp.]|nr:protein-arginine deiminase family protein [Candidatus Rifleibacterium sp.]HPT47404.1 protein-arginine deiminase family protein [Candidatus Rifleibacterium sp.]